MCFTYCSDKWCFKLALLVALYPLQISLCLSSASHDSPHTLVPPPAACTPTAPSDNILMAWMAADPKICEEQWHRVLLFSLQRLCKFQVAEFERWSLGCWLGLGCVSLLLLAQGLWKECRQVNSAMFSKMTACITTQNRRMEGRQGDTRDLQWYSQHPSISNNKASTTFFGGEGWGWGLSHEEKKQQQTEVRKFRVPSVTFKQKRSGSICLPPRISLD